jgi:hypothetical protein
MEWDGVSVIAEVHERWKVLCKLCTCTSRRGSTEGSEIDELWC